MSANPTISEFEKLAEELFPDNPLIREGIDWERIRREYAEMRKAGKKYKEAIAELAEDYPYSAGKVRRIVKG